MSIYDYQGRPVFEGSWLWAADGVKSFDTALLNVPRGATHWVRYTTGSVANLTPGETLTGGTSSKTCVLVADIGEGGAFGTTNKVGIILVASPSGAFQAETLTGGTSSGTVAIIQDLIEIPHGIVHPRAAFVAGETKSINITMSGVTPTATGGTNHGITLASGSSWRLSGLSEVKNFKARNAVNSETPTLKYILFY